MDLRLLEYFLAVAEIGNITKAAERLHTTQPTVSRQLRDLEESLGVTLLTRGKRQVTLTDAGTISASSSPRYSAIGCWAWCWDR